MSKHFFESLERKIDFQFEFKKLEQLVVEEQIWGIVSTYDGSSGYTNESINAFIERHFRSWKRRKRYTSFMELRNHLGFGFSIKNGQYIFANDVNVQRYFLYCEMIMNMVNAFPLDAKFEDQIKVILETIKSTVEDSGFEIRTINDEIMIVEKNAVAIEVADRIPDVSDIIIEYNHYLLKGDLQRKKEILKQIGDSLEPYRNQLETIDKAATSDFFMMLNKMNIRHNNINPKDKANYIAFFAEASKEEQEKWYDLVYEQSLLLYVLLMKQSRAELITNFKKRLN